MNRRPFPFVALALMFVACSSSAPSPTGGTGGSSPTGGSGGSGGSGGTGGSPTGGAGGSTTGGSGGSTSPDGGTSPVDSGTSPVDSGTVTPTDGGGSAPDAAPAAGVCGTMMPNLSSLNGDESVIFGPDGTAYSSNRLPNIGRSVPPYDKPENNWAKSPKGDVFGIILDPKKKVLYAGSRGGTLYAIHTDDPTMIDTIVPVEAGINGVTLGEDGWVYYSDQTNGNLWAVDPVAKTKVQVNKTKVEQANGVAFAPDGRLCAATYTTPGSIICLKLDAMKTEMARDTLMTGSKGKGDGLAFDKAGNAFMTGGALYKITPAGTASMVSPTGGTGIEFGAGPINCKTMYVASGIHSVMSDVEGADVPWHRP